MSCSVTMAEASELVEAAGAGNIVGVTRLISAGTPLNPSTTVSDWVIDCDPVVAG